MKISHLLSLLPLLALVPACGENGDEAPDALAAADKAVETDVSKVTEQGTPDVAKLTPELMQTKFTELTGEITTQLQAITDKASAMDLSAKLAPMVDQLSQMKDQLGDKMPSLDVVTKAVDALKLKFAGDESILKVLEPVLEKLQALAK